MVSDEEYWKGLLITEECRDPLASAIKTLTKVIKLLDKERYELVKETEKGFSDIMCLIDNVNDIGDESSTYEMAVKLCKHYEQTKKENV